MDTYLDNGDMQFDLLGDVKKIDGIKEIIQRINIRLKIKKGNFPYNTNLGNEIYNLDINNIDNIQLKSIIQDALEDIEEAQVIDVEKMIDYEQKILYLTVYLNITGETVLLEVKNKMWGDF